MTPGPISKTPLTLFDSVYKIYALTLITNEIQIKKRKKLSIIRSN